MAHMLLVRLWAYNDYFMRCGLIVQIKKEKKKERNGNFASLQTTQPCADNEISWADIEFPFSPGALLFPISIIVCFKSSLWQNLHAQEKGMLFITWRITWGESFDFFSCAVALFFMVWGFFVNSCLCADIWTTYFAISKPTREPVIMFSNKDVMKSHLLSQMLRFLIVLIGLCSRGQNSTTFHSTAVYLYLRLISSLHETGAKRLPKWSVCT